MQFTDKSVRDLKPATARREIYENTGTGLLVIIQARWPNDKKAATKTYAWRGRDAEGKLRKVTIGRIENYTAKAARAEALRMAGMVAKGEDPAPAKVTKAADAMTVSDAFDLYLKLVCGDYRTNSEMLNTFNRDVKPTIGHKAITAVTEDELGAMLAKATLIARSKGLADYKLINPFFRWAADASRGRSLTGLKANPMVNVGKPAANAKARTRTLNPAEIVFVLKACRELRDPAFRIRTKGRECIAFRKWAFGVEVLLRTGQRSSDILDMVDSEISWEAGVLTVPEERYKTGMEHVLPLPGQVVDLLRNVPRPVSSGANSSRFFQRLGSTGANMDRIRAKVDEIAGYTLPRWTRHDLRRTMATVMQDAWDEQLDRPVADDVEVEAVLGHTVKGVRKHYNHSNLLRSKRRLLTWWNDYLDGLVAAADAKTAEPKLEAA